MPVPFRHRALLDLIVDALQQAVRGRLALPESVQRLHLPREPGSRRQHGMLTAQVRSLPTQHVAEKDRRLVVEVVTGGDDVVAVLDGDRVEQVPFRESARPARSSVRRGGGARDVVAEVGGEIDLVELQASIVRERARGVSGGVGVLPDPEPEVEPVGGIAEPEEEVPQRERVLPARHGHDDALAGANHVVVLDGPADLLAAVLQEVVAAEGGVVPADVEHRRAPAHTALHAAPPEVTGRISTTSVSDSRASRVTSVSPWMTSTDSGLTSSCSSSAETVSGPGISTSRRGLRSTTFTTSQGTGRSSTKALRVSGNRSDLEPLARLELGPVHGLRTFGQHALRKREQTGGDPGDQPPARSVPDAPAQACPRDAHEDVHQVRRTSTMVRRFLPRNLPNRYAPTTKPIATTISAITPTLRCVSVALVDPRS